MSFISDGPGQQKPGSNVSSSMSDNGNLLQKLRAREMYGKFQPYSKQNSKVPCVFNRVLDRLVFQLRRVFPLSALKAGHIFLGFSRCGQFLLTYTHLSDLEVNLLMVSHKYKLHWWRFVPYEKAVKVAEVTLFADQGIYDSVKILVCYWPGDNSKILIHGTSTSPDAENRICYLTVTAVPSLSSCKDCTHIADSYGEEDLAASWDSCVRFSCLRHGWTVHSSYSTVPPFPNFNANISLRKDGSIVINTGNFLHVLSAQVKFPNTDATLETSSTQSVASESPRDVSVEPEVRSDWEDDASSATSSAKSPCNTFSAAVNNSQQKKRLEAESEYDFIEDSSETQRETISVFRKRRLADKKYEFKDENAENVVPLKVLRRRRGKTLWGAVSPSYASLDRAKEIECGGEWEWSSSSPSQFAEVLRPFNSNVAKSPHCDDECEESGEEESVSVCSTPRPTSGNAQSSRTSLPKCVAQFHRRYFEVDDELVSVITDIEEDDLSSSTGYHTALHLEVHGSGYAQMQMVSNAKAEKLNVPHVLAKQLSIDTEQFCHEMAQRLCTLANKKYWFCSDFEVEIIDVSLESNDVVATAFMLLEADCLNGNKIQRKFCQAGVYFAWNMKTGQHRVIDYDLPDEVPASPLSELSGPNGRWQKQPVQDLVRRLRKEATPPSAGLKCAYILSNIPEITGRSLSVLFDPSRTVAIVLDENELPQ